MFDFAFLFLNCLINLNLIIQSYFYETSNFFLAKSIFVLINYSSLVKIDLFIFVKSAFNYVSFTNFIKN